MHPISCRFCGKSFKPERSKTVLCSRACRTSEKRRDGWTGPKENTLKGRNPLTHGQSYTNTYSSWIAMRKRCNYPNHPQWKRYGGKGITVCERWMKFENFLEDMGHRPIGTTLDRWPEQDKGYKPGNCRWATPQQQQRNLKSNRFITFNGETRLLCEWAEKLNVPTMTLYSRLERWSTEKAFTKPFTIRKILKNEAKHVAST